MRLDGSAALVSGGASGLGLATAELLVAEGCAVVIVDLPNSDGATVARRLGDRARFAPGDVCDEGAVAEAVRTATDLGPLRLVLNAAGTGNAQRVLGRRGPHPLADFERVVRVNLVGTFNVLRLTAEAMVANEPNDGERGVIVNTASIAAFDGQIGQAAYSASKSGVAGMTLPIARELADHLVRVVTIAPGFFETPLVGILPPAAQDSMRAQVLHPARLGRPEEFARLVQHIAENAMVNGEVIRIDGGVRIPVR